MSFVATAIVGGAVIGVGGSIVAGKAAGKGAKKAAETTAAAADAATAEQRRQFDIAQEQLAPFRDIGEESLFMLSDLLGLEAPTGEGEAARPRSDQFGSLTQRFTGEDLAQDPGFQFRLKTGREALEKSAAARGGLLSGRTGKALTEFGQQLGSQEFGAAFDRFRATQGDLFGRLFSVSESGRGAAVGSAQLGVQQGQQIGQNILAGGRATTQGQLGVGQAQSGIATNIANTGINALENFQFQNLLNQQQGFQQSGGFGTSPSGGQFGTGGQQLTTSAIL